MKIKFKTVGTSRPLARHRLQFASKEDLEAALEMEKKHGCLRFNNDKEKNLVGNVVRIAREHLMLEVDAAVDTD